MVRRAQIVMLTKEHGLQAVDLTVEDKRHAQEIYDHLRVSAQKLELNAAFSFTSYERNT